VRFATSIESRLGAYIVELTGDPKLSAAEITRRVGQRAEELGLRRPSYAAVRLLVGDARLAARLKAGERSRTTSWSASRAAPTTPTSSSTSTSGC
jgi:hypothetical protein